MAGARDFHDLCEVVYEDTRKPEGREAESVKWLLKTSEGAKNEAYDEGGKDGRPLCSLTENQV